MSNDGIKQTRYPSKADALDDDVFVDVDNESTKSADSSQGEMSLAKDETKMVLKFRCILLCLLLATAIAVSLTAYIMIKNGEEEEFEANFESHATKVIESFETEAANKRTAIISLSRQFSSHAHYANQTFPFVSLPDFEIHARLTLDLAEVIGIFFLPLVTLENLEAWQNYSLANQDWFWEGMAMQSRRGFNATSSGVAHFDQPEGLQLSPHVLVFDQDGPDEDLMRVTNETGPFFPVWQYSPQIPVPVINADFRTLPTSKNELDAYLENDARRNMAGPSFEFETGGGGAVFLDLLLERWQGGGGHYEGGPLSYYYVPVYNFSGTYGEDSSLVGVMQAFIYWQTYFERLLPEQAKGIVAVLDNTCNQTYTFSIHGNDARFEGNGDLHDPKYDYLEEATEYGVFLQRSPDGRDGDTGGCFYRIHLYPSQEMHDQYCTWRPLVISLAIFGVFLFTVVTFILYDRFVERRQRLVMKTAKQTSDVVHKLFPEEVRERLYASDGNGTDSDKKPGAKLGNKAPVNTSLVSADTSTTTSGLINGCSPIADEYLHCTVFFADLAGFTKWSSTRTPSEVFLLLETLYGAFDKIARKLGVFKVETIGDCYVAVTGLPKPQEQHALIMTKFAANCIVKMNQIINSENILLTLGDDTAVLEMRVGMHSGPVTAGVLRGEKARFQLFGDTVNTASRMESNGQKGRIQVSQSTADLLVAAGKERWLNAREDKIEAKGKGLMQTYWVDISADASVRSSVLSSSIVDSHGSGDNLDFLMHLRLPGEDDPAEGQVIPEEGGQDPTETQEQAPEMQQKHSSEESGVGDHEPEERYYDEESGQGQLETQEKYSDELSI